MDIFEQVKQYMSDGQSLEDAIKRIENTLHKSFNKDVKSWIRREIEFDKHIRKVIDE